MLKYIAGILLCIGGILFGIVGSGAFLKVIESNIPFSIYVKYILLFMPFTVMLAHSFFFLIPNSINTITKNRHLQIFLTLLFTMFFSFLFFWGDKLFTNLEFPVIMAVLGLIFSGVFILTNSFEFSLGGYFLVMYFNTLGEAKYFDFNWVFLIIGFLITMSLYAYGRIKLIGNTSR